MITLKLLVDMSVTPLLHSDMFLQDGMHVYCTRTHSMLIHIMYMLLEKQSLQGTYTCTCIVHKPKAVG